MIFGVVAVAACAFGLVWVYHRIGNSAVHRRLADTGGGDPGTGYFSRNDDGDCGDGGSDGGGGD